MKWEQVEHKPNGLFKLFMFPRTNVPRDPEAVNFMVNGAWGLGSRRSNLITVAMRRSMYQ